MSLNKRAFQIIQDEGPKFNPADFEPIGYDLIKDLRDFYRGATKPTFKGVIHTVELFNGPWIFDSMGGRTIHPVRMWYNKDFMKDIAIKIKLYPWIPVIPIEYTGYHTNPKMYGNPETNKWFIKNTVNK